MTGNIDVNAFVQWMLRESYLAMTEDLRNHAHRVTYFKKEKEEVRELLNEMLNQMMDCDCNGAERSLNAGAADLQAEWLMKLFV